MKTIAQVILITIFSLQNMIAQTDCPMRMGVNLYFNEYWSGEFPFADLMLQSASKWNVLDQGNPEQDEWGSVLYHDSLSKDANGYPLEIPQNFKSQDEPQIARKFVLLDANGSYPTENKT